MRSYTFISAALILAASFTAAADAAVEVTFLQSFQLSTDRIVTYTPGGVSTLAISGTAKSLNPTQVAGLALLKPAFGPATQIFTPVDLFMSATSAALVTNTGLQFEQGGFTGSLTYSWFDPVGLVTRNLLTATFVDAILNVDLGATPSGSFIATHPTQAISYTSDIFDVDSIVEADFALAFSSINTTFVNRSGVGTAFQANVVGTFAAAVPEPATWAMMIAGFGMVGFAARRRRGMRAVTA